MMLFSSMQRCCLSFVSNLFNILLQHQSFFVQLEAMKTLKAFAEVISTAISDSKCMFLILCAILVGLLYE